MCHCQCRCKSEIKKIVGDALLQCADACCSAGHAALEHFFSLGGRPTASGAQDHGPLGGGPPTSATLKLRDNKKQIQQNEEDRTKLLQQQTVAQEACLKANEAVEKKEADLERLWREEISKKRLAQTLTDEQTTGTLGPAPGPPSLVRS